MLLSLSRAASGRKANHPLVIEGGRGGCGISKHGSLQEVLGFLCKKAAFMILISFIFLRCNIQQKFINLRNI